MAAAGLPAGTFYFLCSILDGYSRYIVHEEIREKMEEIDVETIVVEAFDAHEALKVVFYPHGRNGSV